MMKMMTILMMMTSKRKSNEITKDFKTLLNRNPQSPEICLTL